MIKPGHFAIMSEAKKKAKSGERTVQLAKARTMLSLFKREDESVSRQEILQRARKESYIGERTARNYLDLLVEKRMLFQDSLNYKPNCKEWHKMQMEIHRPRFVSLFELEKFQPLADTIYTKFKEATGVDFDDKKLEKLKEYKKEPRGLEVSPGNLKTLASLTIDLLDALDRGLSVDYLAGGEDPPEIYGLLWDNFTKVAGAYMAAWQFIYSTQGASGKFSDEIEILKTRLKSFPEEGVFRHGKDSP